METQAQDCEFAHHQKGRPAILSLAWQTALGCLPGNRNATREAAGPWDLPRTTTGPLGAKWWRENGKGKTHLAGGCGWCWLRADFHHYLLTRWLEMQPFWRASAHSATPSCNLLIAGALLLRTEVVPQRCQKRDCSHAAARVRPCVANLEHIPQTYPQ